jgi:U3 small nucleolar RNA-associated protein 19
LEHSICSSEIEFLNALGQPPQDNSDLKNSYFTHGKLYPVGEVPKMVKVAKAHRKKAQDAWLAILRQKLSKNERKQILRNLVSEVIPWISTTERLMDFLTDSFNEDGEMSLLALPGLFYLMQEKNLDYPSFYQKLYSLLDDGLLQSKHRSRFFRLLDTFMASTHLPAALVASFIKRLSRLALHAPPSGIVVAVPWIYNMFKRHPACTFMMHREAQSEEEREDWEQYGVEDPFDMSEPNPMETRAIDSCVWELETLQSHYHPNVATLAKIISEQFTKQQYNLEDFLDYSYNLVSKSL